MENPSFAPDRASQPFHLSDSSNFTTDSTMPADHAELSTRRLRSHDVVRGSKEIPPVSGLPDSSSPVLQDSSFESGIDPTTERTAYILRKPSSRGEIKAIIEEIHDQLTSASPSHSQYLWVQYIKSDLFAELNDEKLALKGVRTTVFYEKNEILYKVMAGPFHEKIPRGMVSWIEHVFHPMHIEYWNEDFWSGGTGEKDGRFCSKQPDASFYPGPDPLPGQPIPWPSLVVEVGMSESARQLQADARWWYSNSGHQTKVVVLIDADPITHNANVEIWTPVLNQHRGADTRDRPTHVLECTQRAHLRNGVVQGADLRIPFQAVMRRPIANPLETDLILTAAQIRRICR
ncbi:unnamed protein product [Penicillium salamii]|uniref:Uncharacterized protein n=1 Tax=Penicillium salamii TaxID=1612424 RepID=A0A9W4J4Q0_9EURO|nr:unnamed protein product [Penicillium salamii]CAG8009653.1 unnamed protein product [Penicillium salamii]CAG8022509.1 unnamed protein product [Penicillium salamii]CAG8119223.1 unnamed protein product [Penicillium salamii]CAG8154926.1 unnamed protein product [Penicillium salamii]